MFPLPLYSVWPYTPVIPAFYWNAKSTEEIIQHLACEYDSITHYLDTLADAINQQTQRIDNFIADVNAKLNGWDKAIDQLQTQLEHVGDKQLIWDVTQGQYTDSKTALRNLYRELAVFGARVNQIADITVDQLAAHRTDETSAVGNLTIFDDDTPRVTDPTTGDPYPAL